MTEKKKPLTVTLRFRWDTCTPDPRQFNQQRQVLNPDYLVEIDLPLETVYVRNKAEILSAQISSDLNVPAPILTPAGMFLAVSLLEAPFELEIEQRVDEALDNSNVDWGDGETEDTGTWDDSIDTDEPSTQFEPEETIIPDDDVGLDNANVDWEDEKSWD